jgi:taurine transport system permease protein
VARALVSVASLGLLLLLWWYATEVAQLVSPFVLPSPGDVISGLARVSEGYMGGSLMEHFTASMSVMLSGFLLALVIGIPLGILMAWIPIMDRLFGPLLTVLRPIPPPAWIPLAILWFGIGIAGKTFIVFVAAFVPVLVNAYVGCKETPINLLNAARTLGASQRTILMEVVLPSAMPVILTGARISLGVAWATIVAAELVVADQGFGFLIMNGYRNFEANIMAGGMLLIGVIGILMNLGFVWLERVLLRWNAEVR